MPAGARRRSFGISLAMFLVLATASTIAWFSVRSTRDYQMELETGLITQQVQQRLQSWFATRAAMIEQLAQYWPTQFENRPDHYRARVLQLLDAFEGFQAINFVDRNSVIAMVVPVAGNEKALGMDLTRSPFASVQAALAKGQSGTVARTDATIQLLQGGVGFATYYPVYGSSGEQVGCLNGVFRVHDAMQSFLKDDALRDRFRLWLREASGATAFQNDDVEQQWPYGTQCDVQIIDRPIELVVAPSQSFLASHFDRLPAVILVIALAAFLIFSFLLWGFLRKSEAYEQTDAERRSSELERARIATIIDAAADFIGMSDRDLTVVYMNQAGRKMLGFDATEDVSTYKVADCHPPEIGQQIKEELLPVVLRDGYWQGETDFQTRDGRIVPTSQTIVCHRDDDGEPSGFSTIARDISNAREAEQERLSLEAQLQYAQKLESLGILAGGIAHDFNNILTGILGAADLARQQCDDPEVVATYLDTINNSSKRAAGLCQQMLAYSGRAQLNKEPLDLAPIVSGIVDLLRVSIPKTHEIRLELAPGLGAVNGDSAQLSQVVLNLIKNASDSMAESPGTVSVVLQQCELTREQLRGSVLEEHLAAGSYLVLDITDQGCGIGPESLARIFDPFFTTRGPGRGLGLAAVLGIIRGHGGGVFVDSKVDHGTEFRVILPTTNATVPTVAELPTEPAALGNDELVLVVDDEETIRELVVHALDKVGYAVISAADGEAGWDLYQQRRADIKLVVLDLSMPKLGGLEVLAKIRKVDMDLPVALTSGYSTEADQVSELDQPSTVFLHKPYSVSQLQATVAAALASTEDTTSA
ncbi:MAG: response regulator [Planctomycetota bacterium]